MQDDNSPMNTILKAHKKFVSTLPFALGQRVVISGLLGVPEHNGKTALVRGFKANRERVVVEVTGQREGAPGVSKLFLSIKPKNLSAT
eukprot:COSAG02_NODE_7726_length_2873_cov_8.636945_2_plen_88_part_00